MRWVIIWFQNITVATIKVVMYTTGDWIHFVSRLLFRNKWLHYSLEKIYIVVSCILPHRLFFFLSDSLSSDYTAYLRRSASKTKCTVNGAIIRADRKSRVKNGVHPTRPGPKLPRFITPPLLSCRVPFLSVLLKGLW